MLEASVLVILCLAALLAVPVEFAFSVRRRETFDGAFVIGWLFGAVRAPIPLKGSAKPSPVKKKTKKKGKWSGGLNGLAVIRNGAFRRRTIRLARDIFGAMNVSGLILRARVGLDDPADTGMLWGAAGPLAGVLAGTRRADITIQPEFAYEVFELDGEGNVRLVPLRLIFIVARYLASPVTVRMIWKLTFQNTR